MMKKPARDNNGKLYFMYRRLSGKTEVEILRGKVLTTFIIHDNGELEVTSVQAKE